MIRLLLATVLTAALATNAAAQPAPAAKPEGEMRWALYVTLAPAWFDPGETTAGFLTPFWILYALHDALVKPMTGNHLGPLTSPQTPNVRAPREPVGSSSGRQAEGPWRA